MTTAEILAICDERDKLRQALKVLVRTIEEWPQPNGGDYLHQGALVEPKAALKIGEEKHFFYPESGF